MDCTGDTVDCRGTQWIAGGHSGLQGDTVDCRGTQWIAGGHCGLQGTLVDCRGSLDTRIALPSKVGTAPPLFPHIHPLLLSALMCPYVVLSAPICSYVALCCVMWSALPIPSSPLTASAHIHSKQMAHMIASHPHHHGNTKIPHIHIKYIAPAMVLHLLFRKSRSTPSYITHLTLISHCAPHHGFTRISHLLSPIDDGFTPFFNPYCLGSGSEMPGQHHCTSHDPFTISE